MQSMRALRLRTSADDPAAHWMRTSPTHRRQAVSELSNFSIEAMSTFKFLEFPAGSIVSAIEIRNRKRKRKPDGGSSKSSERGAGPAADMAG